MGDNEQAKAFRPFGPFVKKCKEVGISRSRAYELDRDGDLETFLIGRRRYIYLDSIYSLPNRLAAKQAAAGE